MGVTVEVVELLNMVESLAKYTVLVEKNSYTDTSLDF